MSTKSHSIELLLTGVAIQRYPIFESHAALGRLTVDHFTTYLSPHFVLNLANTCG